MYELFLSFLDGDGAGGGGLAARGSSGYLGGTGLDALDGAALVHSGDLRIAALPQDGDALDVLPLDGGLERLALAHLDGLGGGVEGNGDLVRIDRLILVLAAGGTEGGEEGDGGECADLE